MGSVGDEPAQLLLGRLAGDERALDVVEHLIERSAHSRHLVLGWEGHVAEPGDLDGAPIQPLSRHLRGRLAECVQWPRRVANDALSDEHGSRDGHDGDGQRREREPQHGLLDLRGRQPHHELRRIALRDVHAVAAEPWDVHVVDAGTER